MIDKISPSPKPVEPVDPIDPIEPGKLSPVLMEHLATGYKALSLGDGDIDVAAKSFAGELLDNSVLLEEAKATLARINEIARKDPELKRDHISAVQRKVITAALAKMET